VLWNEYLEESLGTPFTADEGAVGFRKRSGRKNEFSLPGCRVVEVIERDRVGRHFKKSVDFGSGSAPIQIVFQNDYGVGVSVSDRLKRSAERASIHECHAGAVA